MRKQYYFRPSNRGLLAWDVDRLSGGASPLHARVRPLRFLASRGRGLRPRIANLGFDREQHAPRLAALIPWPSMGRGLPASASAASDDAKRRSESSARVC